MKVLIVDFDCTELINVIQFQKQLRKKGNEEWLIMGIATGKTHDNVKTNVLKYKELFSLYPQLWRVFVSISSDLCLSVSATANPDKPVLIDGDSGWYFDNPVNFQKPETGLIELIKASYLIDQFLLISNNLDGQRAAKSAEIPFMAIDDFLSPFPVPIPAN